MRYSGILTTVAVIAALVGVAAAFCFLMTDEEDSEAATGYVYPSVSNGSYYQSSSGSYYKEYRVTAYSGYKVPAQSEFTYTKSGSGSVNVSYSPSSDRSYAYVYIYWYSGSASIYFTVNCTKPVDVIPTVNNGYYSIKSTTSNSITYTITPYSGYKVPDQSGFSYYNSGSGSASATYTPSYDRSSATVTVSRSSGSPTIHFTVSCNMRGTLSLDNQNCSCSKTSDTYNSVTYSITPYSGYQVPKQSELFYSMSGGVNASVSYTPSNDRSSASLTVTWNSSYTRVDVKIICTSKSLGDIDFKTTNGSCMIQSTASNKVVYKLTPNTNYVVPDISDISFKIGGNGSGVTVDYKPTTNYGSAEIAITWNYGASYNGVTADINCMNSNGKLSLYVSGGHSYLLSSAVNSETYRIFANEKYILPLKVTNPSSSYISSVKYEPSADRKSATLTVKWITTPYYKPDMSIYCSSDWVKVNFEMNGDSLGYKIYKPDNGVSTRDDSYTYTFSTKPLPYGYKYWLRIDGTTLSSNEEQTEWTIPSSIIKNTGSNVNVDVSIIKADLEEPKAAVFGMIIAAIVAMMAVFVFTRR